MSRRSTTDLARLVAAAGSADVSARRTAFEEIVLRFQDMAFGCAYAALGDYHLAQDAAQCAFVTAWRKLPGLKDMGAFPSWFRKVVLSACHELTRAKAPAVVGVEALASYAAVTPGS